MSLLLLFPSAQAATEQLPAAAIPAEAIPAVPVGPDGIVPGGGAVRYWRYGAVPKWHAPQIEAEASLVAPLGHLRAVAWIGPEPVRGSIALHAPAGVGAARGRFSDDPFVLWLLDVTDIEAA